MDVILLVIGAFFSGVAIEMIFTSIITYVKLQGDYVEKLFKKSQAKSNDNVRM